MSNISKVKAAQTRAKKIIKHYEELGWEIPESILRRANMELPKKMSDRKSQAMIDNLSKYTIDTLKTMSQKIIIEETNPIVSSKRESGAAIYDVLNMEPPTQTSKEVIFNERNIVRRTLNQIKFVMNNAPSRDVAEKIEMRLWAIELHSNSVFETNDRKVRRAALVESLKSEKDILNAVKKAERSGYPAAQALTTLYEDLVGEYGINERGLAARQYRQFENVLENVGAEYSSDSEERQTASNVLRWLIEHDDLWQYYRSKFKLNKIYHQVYDSNSLIADVSDVLVDHPKYKMKILEKLIELIENMTDPWDILEELEAYTEELSEGDE